MPGALNGITVLDLSCTTAGAYAAMLLTEQGADCTRIEPAEAPERRLPASAFFNRGKRSLTLDIETVQGYDVLTRLVKNADIVIVDSELAVRERLRVDYETLARLGPRLVYCSITDMGEKGPLSRKPSNEGVLGAFAGTYGAQGGFGQPPVYVFLPFASYGAAFLIAYGACLAVFNREMSGKGQKVETSLLAASLAMEAGGFISSPSITAVTATGSVQQGVLPAYRLYQCQDDWLIIACGNSTFWNKLCLALDRLDLLSDPRFEGMPWALADVENRLILTEIIGDMLKQKPRSHWLRLFEENDVPCAPVYSRREFMDDPQVQHNQMIFEVEDRYFGRMRQPGVPLTMTDYPVSVKGRAPLPGEHTDEVLKEAGFSSREIRGLKKKGVI